MSHETKWVCDHCTVIMLAAHVNHMRLSRMGDPVGLVWDLCDSCAHKVEEFVGREKHERSGNS